MEVLAHPGDQSESFSEGRGRLAEIHFLGGRTGGSGRRSGTEAETGRKCCCEHGLPVHVVSSPDDGFIERLR